MWKDACQAVNNCNINLVDQPAQSPDTDINDLGFFASLQADTWKMKHGANIDQLISNVETPLPTAVPIA